MRTRIAKEVYKALLELEEEEEDSEDEEEDKTFEGTVGMLIFYLIQFSSRFCFFFLYSF